jgi:hypothetical protein
MRSPRNRKRNEKVKLGTEKIDWPNKQAPVRGGGDGRINVGYIGATGADGGQSLSLGKIRIDGDLGRIRAGELGSDYGVVSLTVDSMGA